MNIDGLPKLTNFEKLQILETARDMLTNLEHGDKPDFQETVSNLNRLIRELEG